MTEEESDKNLRKTTRPPRVTSTEANSSRKRLRAISRSRETPVRDTVRELLFLQYRQLQTDLSIAKSTFRVCWFVLLLVSTIFVTDFPSVFSFICIAFSLFMVSALASARVKTNLRSLSEQIAKLDKEMLDYYVLVTNRHSIQNYSKPLPFPASQIQEDALWMIAFMIVMCIKELTVILSRIPVPIPV